MSTLGMYWGMSGGGVATVRDLGAFWCAACEITNNGHCPPTQVPPEGRVTSLPWSWLLQILWCAGEGCEGGWSVGLAQDGRCSKVAAGDPAVTTSNLSLSCFRNRQWMCAPYQESSAFHGSSVSPGSPPAGWGDLSPPSRTPAPKGPICGSNHSLPRVGSPLPHIFPFPLSPRAVAQVPMLLLSFSSYLITCVSFLELWCTGVLPPVCSENCPTCRLSLMCSSGEVCFTSLYSAI